MALVKIRYKGLSDVRVITVEDAKRHGVELSQDLVWDRQGEAAGPVADGAGKQVKRPRFPNADNGIVVDGLSDELLKVLRAEGSFTITEVDKDTGVEKDDIIVGKAIDDTGDTVVDNTTGQKDKKK